jgi:hypothetical protein
LKIVKTIADVMQCICTGLGACLLLLVLLVGVSHAIWGSAPHPLTNAQQACQALIDAALQSTTCREAAPMPPAITQ